ncbi:type-2 ice-structuring protein-like [Thunnus albacares]|uniref:type-2 ice-structuring protein-like n=1 Tax=Thunnus albacares TaxID=8236 RepID=UPI001CF71271|nr:type-2 ice-structuring protein-like [Thunnus albacares]XP_044197757.1 type-2 ice-structuring protein-like [Thunnus albacares]
MKMLAVSLLVCVMMALTTAVALPEADPEKSDKVRISTVCPSGWTGFSGRCFLYVQTPVSWADAERNCLSRGGNLASVQNIDEHHIIQSMILRITHTYPLAWLGGSDAQQEGTWFWSDGSPFSFSYWGPGQPDNRESADCLVMNHGDDKKFDDEPCHFTRSFVCARNE